MRVVLAVALALTLSGCLAAQPPTPGGDDGAHLPEPVLPLDVPLDPKNCFLTGTILLVPLDQVQRHLPEGFRARDAQVVLGTPAATGRGAALAFNIDCKDSALAAGYHFAELLLTVYPPMVEADLKPSTVDHYAVTAFATEGALRDLFEGAGWPMEGQSASLSISWLPSGGVGTGTYRDADGRTAWTYEVTATTEIVASNLERIWRVTDTGLAFIEHDYSNRVYLGPARCTFAAGTAAVLGRSACEATDVGLVIPESSWKARFVTLPNATDA
jgi:hypothetical protein